MRVHEPVSGNLVLCQLWSTTRKGASSMKSPSLEPTLLTILVLISVVSLGLGSASAIQVNQLTSTPTFTVSTTTSMLVTTQITMTTTSTQYSNITNIFKSTSTEGTQTATVYSTTTTTISSATTAFAAQTTVSTMTRTSIASLQILGNQLGELLVGLSVVAAIASILVPKILAATRSGLVCKKCGYRNPPFVRSFCTGCGEALRSKSTLRAGKSSA